MDGDSTTPNFPAKAVELLGHYRLTDKPQRTLEALQIFFSVRADEYYSAMRAGKAVRVDSNEPGALVGRLASQGFRVRLVD